MSFLKYLEKKDNKKCIILGCTGSVATIKVPQIISMLTEESYEVIIIPTNCALHFLYTQAIADKKLDVENNRTCTNNSSRANIGESDYSSTSIKFCCNDLQNKFHKEFQGVKQAYPHFKMICDFDEWDAWNKRGDPVLHIQLRDWADLLLIAPLDANTLSKVSHGLCDNLLTCLVRAWDINKPLLFCPAMNTHMYSHPFTSQQIKILKDLKYIEIEAVSKKLACGDYGLGAMAEVDSIVSTVNTILKSFT